MLEEKQEAKQESKMTRRALFRFLGLGSLAAVLGTALITKVTVSGQKVQPMCNPVLCAPSWDKCKPWADELR